MNNEIYSILNDMSDSLSVEQMKRLQEVLLNRLSDSKHNDIDINNIDLLKMYLSAKKLEGCTERTIQSYKYVLDKFLSMNAISIRGITTENIRQYLNDYQGINNCSKVSLENIKKNAI